MAENKLLLEKITTYSNQLLQVNSILEADPTNEQFLKIRDDLQKVIVLTSDLLKYQNSDDNITDIIVDTNGSDKVLEAFDTANEAEADFNEHDDDDDDDDEDQNEFNASSIVQPTGIIQIGEVVEVIGGDRPYAGVVTGILNPSEYRVKYFEYETEVTLPITSLTRIQPGVLAKEDVLEGFKGQCKFSQDQLYYDIVVQKVTDHGAIVLYTQYGNTEEVPLAYIRPLIQKQKKNKESTLIKIPENLKILPTDTEEEKQRKKKKIKAIKNKNRIVTKELEVAAVQQSWQKFVSKTAKKPLSGIIKNSIFTSPEEVEGKVGVTNSGKGLTEYIQRKKHKF